MLKGRIPIVYLQIKLFYYVFFCFQHLPTFEYLSIDPQSWWAWWIRYNYVLEPNNG